MANNQIELTPVEKKEFTKKLNNLGYTSTDLKKNTEAFQRDYWHLAKPPLKPTGELDEETKRELRRVYRNHWNDLRDPNQLPPEPPGSKQPKITIHPAVPPFTPFTPFLIVGHRGSPTKKVENTIESYKQALLDGANALEIDLCLTRDGEVIVWHDWNPDTTEALWRQRGAEGVVSYMPLVPEPLEPYDWDWTTPLPPYPRKRTSQLKLDEFRRGHNYARKTVISPGTNRPPSVNAPIPTFEEFVDWAKTQTRLLHVFLDIKIPNDEDSLIPRMLDRIDMSLRKHYPNFTVVLLSPEENVHVKMKNYAPQYQYSLDVQAPPLIVLHPSKYSGVKKAIEHHNTFATDGRPVLTIYPSPKQSYRETIKYDVELRRNHNANPANKPVEKLIGWTVDEEDEMKDLIQLGVDGLLTNKPELLYKVARALKKV